MKLLIGADLVPTKSNEAFFETADVNNLVSSDLLSIMNDVDYRIFNLETPLGDETAPINKCGSNFIASTSTIAGIKRLGANFFTLANNHIMDQGTQGLKSTMDILDLHGIAYAGVGRSAMEAAEPHIIEINDKKVGIYCCAEHEFSIVTEHEAGANPFDPLESFDHVQELRKKVNYIIVLYHGGKEYYRYPSPELQRVCRKFVDKGADIVVCQHSHCIGCEEKWNKGTIVYGQGNFLFDDDDNEFYQTSLLIQIDTEDNSISYIPIQKDGAKVRLATDHKQVILTEFYKRSNEIKMDGFIHHEYLNFADRMIIGYLLSLHGNLQRKLLYRILNRLSKGALGRNIIKKSYKTYEFTRIFNYLSCESHRELILYGVQNQLERRQQE